MSELDEKLNSILSDPAEMEKLMGMAKQLSGKLQAGDAPESEFAALDPKLMALAGRFLSLYRRRDDKSALITAMKPYLSRERQDEIEKAARIARITSAARAVLSDGHV